jgi:hypothetical protein
MMLTSLFAPMHRLHFGLVSSHLTLLTRQARQPVRDRVYFVFRAADGPAKSILM